MRIARGKEEADGAATVPLVAATLPYAFARKYGVILRHEPGTEPHVALRAGADPLVLVELRRLLGQAFAVDQISTEQFDTLLEAQVLAEDWRIEYNSYRPHSSLGDLTPEAFKQQWTTTQPALS